jgi:hypothetical protein
MNEHALGSLVSEHPVDTYRYLKDWVLDSLIVVAVGALILWAGYAIYVGAFPWTWLQEQLSGSRYDTSIMGLGVAFMLGGLWRAVLGWWKKPHETFFLHEKGVRIPLPEGEVAIPFVDLADVVLFCGLKDIGATYCALRQYATQPWQVVTYWHKGREAFIDGLLAGQIQQRGAVLNACLEAGETVDFHYIGKSTRAQAATKASSMFSRAEQEYLARFAQCKTLHLYRDRLEMPKETIRFQDADHLLADDEIRLVDSYGNDKLALPYSSLVSADLLVALLTDRLQKPKTPSSD